MTTGTAVGTGEKTVTVVGVGNTGSPALNHLARLPGVAKIVVCDFDTYETKNFTSQEITLADVGRPKAAAQARRLRRLAPNIIVEPIHARVEHVPLAQLRADVILSCVDSAEARQYINEIAWRWGTPWVDVGVNGEEMLARVNVYVPGPDAPCFECQMTPDDYAALEQIYPCTGDRPVGPAPTNASSALGSLAAALQVIECTKLLDGDLARAAIGHEVLLNAGGHRHFVTRLRRNPHCLFDHATWDIKPIGTPATRLALGAVLGAAGAVALRVDHRRFVTELTCPVCNSTREVVRLTDRLGPTARRCRRCRYTVTPRGFDLRDRLDASELSPKARRRSLAQLGLQSGDVFTVSGPSGDQHYQV
jgi:molybdopterin/thiamine biosynthesis adenylyltransferase